MDRRNRCRCVLVSVVVFASRSGCCDENNVSQYLRAVYPSLSDNAYSSEEKVALYESLEYYYECSEARASQMKPPARCPSSDYPRLPYVPTGEYFVATVDAARDWSSMESLKWTAPASRSRWIEPTRRVEKTDVASSLFSTMGSRLGPAPSWTNPMAIVKKTAFEEEKPKAEDGFYYVEVENFGGPTWVLDCTRTRGVPVCGLWANMYRGTGLFIKLTAISTLVTESKATAVVEMLRMLDTDQILQVSTHLGSPSIKAADDLVATLYARERPCSHVEDLDARRDWEAWSKSSSSSSSREVAERILDHRREPLDWLLGICGYGTLYEKNRRKPFTGFDGLLAVLACFNGFTAIILTVSSNDNGGFMRELIDYDTPRLWQGQCLPMPFSRAGGPRKKQLLRYSSRAENDDAFPEARNQLPDVEELYDYWNRTEKFVLKDPLFRNDEDYGEIKESKRQRKRHHQPCILHRQTNVELCRSTLLAQPDPLDPLHNCFMWCRNTMSESHALISDAHMFWPQRERERRVST